MKMADIRNLPRRPEAAAEAARRAEDVLAQMYAYFDYDDLPVLAPAADEPEYALVA
ncbi:hypothetical protein GI374_09745 [Paracoccus sp. S-4012]|uniref:hypothetical protein n=1 Tax=Paracoccus sp. S-4012 TaxID=2665648 RepID=UPI0012B101E7|nr:hypothetical protein [Paracoccus sp. S-4012]MRX50722.1 hypothetical protein [Paracoccus sp. S-4012]